MKITTTKIKLTRKKDCLINVKIPRKKNNKTINKRISCLINVKIILSITNMKKLNKKNKCQILSIKNIKKNKGLIKERILIKKLKNKKEIGSAKRTTKSKNKWTAFSNSMKLTNCSRETIFKMTESVILTKYIVG